MNLLCLCSSIFCFICSPQITLFLRRSTQIQIGTQGFPTHIQGIHKRMVRFQKLTRDLFLTLHGHSVHRQQRQLSKFLMRYQQFASHTYCGAAGPVFKMASQQEKAFCVLRFEVSRSVITVQRQFRARFRKDAPCVFSKPCRKLTLHCNHRSGHLKTEHTEKPFPAATPSWKLAPRPRSKHEKRTAGSA